MSARSGRLSADIQAIIAADYIRNLQEERHKGFYGRLKQGLYPLKAPLGYLDKGGGKVKEIDPIKGPLVKKIFELYATDNYSIESLCVEAKKMNLTSLANGKLSTSSLHRVLRNPFYAGVMKVKTTGETFSGIHKPLISTELFETVQTILTGGHKPIRRRHQYLFRKHFRCHGCNRFMVGEMQKGNVYYRCHKKNCETKTIREDQCDFQIQEILRKIVIPQEIINDLKVIVTQKINSETTQQTNAVKSLELLLNKTQKRLERLTDAYLDNVLEADVVEQKKQSLLLEKQRLSEEINNVRSSNSYIKDKLSTALELLKNPLESYKLASNEKKTELLEKLHSNAFICGKKVLFELKFPFDLWVNQTGIPHCGRCRHGDRKIDGICVTAAQLPEPNRAVSKKAVKKFAEQLIDHYSTEAESEKCLFH